MSINRNQPEQVWAQAFTLLASDGRLKIFYQTPRYEMRGIMEAHASNAAVDLFKLFGLLKDEKKKEAYELVESLGQCRLLAMMMIFNRLVHHWRELEGFKSASA